MEIASVVRERLPTRSQWAPIAIWLLGWPAFAVIAGLAAAYSRFPSDEWLTHRLQDIDAVGFSRAVDWAEDAADLPWALVVWLLAVAGLVVMARRWEALLLLLIMAGRGLNAGLKELVERPRPSPELVRAADDPAGFSFPSGHATAAILLYGFLIYLATVAIPQPLLRVLIQLACLYVIAFTALERVYVGAHWPSDILGSALLGGLILAAFIWTHRQISA